MADQLGRIRMAVTLIALIATGLYQFSVSVSPLNRAPYALIPY